MNKYKKSGWKWESTRHSLASKGIKTGRKQDLISHVFQLGEDSVFGRVYRGEKGDLIGTVADMWTPLPEPEYARAMTDTYKLFGLADKKGVTAKDVPSKELSMGIMVEQEHTPSKALAKKIALDHLAENPHYYTMLKKMESQFEKKKKARASRWGDFKKYDKLDDEEKKLIYAEIKNSSLEHGEDDCEFGADVNALLNSTGESHRAKKHGIFYSKGEMK